MEPGDLVSHPEFGFGRIKRTRGDKVDVQFEAREIMTLLAKSLTRVEAVPADMLWRLRDNSKSIAASIERIRPRSPLVAAAFASLLSDLAATVDERFWEVPADGSETLYIRSVTTPNKSKRVAFVALDEKPAPHIVVAVTDIKRLPKDFRSDFALCERGFFNKDYFRAEIFEDKLALMPVLLSAIRAVLARSQRS